MSPTFALLARAANVAKTVATFLPRAKADELSALPSASRQGGRRHDLLAKDCSQGRARFCLLKVIIRG